MNTAKPGQHEMRYSVAPEQNDVAHNIEQAQQEIAKRRIGQQRYSVSTEAAELFGQKTL